MKGSLVYPRTLSPDSDYVTFTHYEYRPNNPNVAAGFEGGASPPSGGQSIRLYMPESTPATTNSNEWGAVAFEGPLGLLRQAMAVGAVGVAHGNFGGMARSLESARKDAGRYAVAGAQQAFVGIVAGLAGMSASQATALARGQVYNPNVELLYQTPGLRAMSFNFRFVASSAEESETIRTIIREFKKWSAPEKAGAYLNVPHLWDIKYTNPDFMGKFKRAALTDVAVQSNPSTPYHTTFGDGAPVEYSIQLNFKETDIITREDHESGIGF